MSLPGHQIFIFDQFNSVPHKIYDICCCEMRMSATSLTFWFIILNCVMQTRPPRAFPLFAFSGPPLIVKIRDVTCETQLATKLHFTLFHDIYMIFQQIIRVFQEKIFSSMYNLSIIFSCREFSLLFLFIFEIWGHLESNLFQGTFLLR